MPLSKEKQVLIQLVREAKQVNGKGAFAKMVCYLEKERGERLSYEYNPDFPRGNYCLDFNKDLQELISRGYISEKAESPNPYEYAPGPREVKINLSDSTLRNIRSIVREYAKYGPKLGGYDHEVYKKKTHEKGMLKLKEFRRQDAKIFLKEAEGDGKKAFDLYCKRKSALAGELTKANPVFR